MSKLSFLAKDRKSLEYFVKKVICDMLNVKILRDSSTNSVHVLLGIVLQNRVAKFLQAVNISNSFA